MRILVCIKKVLADESDIFLREGMIENECLIFKLSPPDLRAFCEGLRIKEKQPGSSLDVVTVDGAASDSLLRTLSALGGDNVYRLWDEALDVGTELSNLALSEILSGFIRRNDYDVMLFGCRSEYLGAGSLPILLSIKLDVPSITSVTQIEVGEGGEMLVHRMMQKGKRVVYRCSPKAILSMESNELASFDEDVESLVMSHGIKVNRVSFEELDVRGGYIRQNTERFEYSYPKPRTKYVMIPESNSVEDRLGFLMSGGIGKKDSSLIEGGPEKVAEEIYNNLVKRNVFKRV
jgi:electron transfer flavoprotein beta subunit